MSHWTRYFGVIGEWCAAPAKQKQEEEIKMENVPSDEFFGRMNDPTAAAELQGPCGDGMAVAKQAKGKSVKDALGINPRKIIATHALPESGRHCAILAVSTLYRALADYLLQP